MTFADFPLLFAIGSLGGLACSLLAAAVLTLLAARRHLGTPLQLALGLLTCLVATALMFAPILWLQNNVNTRGPALAPSEVAFWLAWTGLLGWVAPVGTVIGYALFAIPQATEAGRVSRRSAGPATPLLALDDPIRQLEPLGMGRAWGHLVPITEGGTAGRPLPLSYAITLLGREIDNDIILDDDRVSRHHVEFRWNAGHPQVLDRGSTNGTRHNSQAARGLVPIATGDILEIGSRRYRFEQRAIPRTTPEEETQKMASLSRAAAPPTGAMAEGFYLLTTNGPWLGTRWTVDRPLVTIGRDESCEVCLADGSISRRHAQVIRQANGYYLSDHESANGTYVNGEPVLQPVLLRPGDVVRVGAIELVCVPLDALIERPREPVVAAQIGRAGVPTMPPPPRPQS